MCSAKDAIRAGGKMITHDNKRDHYRMSIETKGEYRRQHATAYASCMVSDLSASGMLLLCNDAIENGEILNIRIHPNNPITPPLDANVEAVRSSKTDDGGFEIACKIINIK
jgi:c-di-GMP-binding flagellar brake protein YcgR